MESLCACGDPDIVNERFHAQAQAVCRKCGNIAIETDMQTTLQDSVRVKAVSNIEKTVRMNDFLDLLNNFTGVQGLSEELNTHVLAFGEDVWLYSRYKRDKDSYAVAAIAIVLERNNIEFTFGKLCETLKVRSAFALRAYKEITGKERVKEEISFSAAMRKFAAKCDEIIMRRLRGPSLLSDIVALANKIYSLVEKEVLYKAFRQSYLVAAICILACKSLAPKGLTNRDVAKTGGLRISPLSTIVAFVSKVLLNLANNIPWKPDHITATNIYVFLQDIVEFTSPVVDNRAAEGDTESIIARKREKVEKAKFRLQTRIDEEKRRTFTQDSLNSSLQFSSQRLSGRMVGSKSKGGSKKHVPKCVTERSGNESEEQNALSDVTESVQKDFGRKRLKSKAMAMSKTQPLCPEKRFKGEQARDAEDLLIEELLLKGCDVDELIHTPYNQISKRYFKEEYDGDEELGDEDGISDTEINSYCLTAEEVKIKEKHLESYYLEGL